MINPQLSHPSRLGALLASAAATALIAGSAPAQTEELIRYNFEDLSANPAADDPAINTAPNSDLLVTKDGSYQGFVEITTGGVANVDGSLYDLGTSISLLFDGDYIDTNSFLTDIPISGLDDYTAMAWMKVADTDGDHMIFGSDIGNRLHLGTRNTLYHSGHWGDDLQGDSTPTPMPATDPGNWHHVTYQGRASDGMQLFFLDGVLAGEGAAGGDADPVDGAFLIGSTGADEAGRNYIGDLDEVRVFNYLLTPEQIQTAMIEGLPIIPVPGISSAAFTARDEITIEITDFDGGTSETDPATVQLFIDDGFGETEVTPVVTKSGDVTSVVYTFPSEPVPFTSYALRIAAMTTAATGGASFEGTASAQSYAIPEVIRAGTFPAPVGMWHLMETVSFDWSLDVPPSLGGGDQAHRDALAVIGHPDTIITAEGTVPVINHSDPDNAGNRGIFTPDLPFLSDEPGIDDNQFVIYGRTTIEITDPADVGEYTIRVTGDDGYALRITGATFTGTAGNATNQIDPNDPSTAFFPIPTGDSNGFLFCDFPAVGQYLVEFVANELGGGAYQEISWAKGRFTSVGGTSAWRLIGDHDSQAPTFASKRNIPESIIPVIPGDGGAATHWWYGAATGGGTDVGNLDQTITFLNDLEAGTALFNDETEVVLDTINHSDNGGNGGVINPTEPFPDQPNPGSEDRIVMLANFRVRITDPGDYTFQVRSDDGFLLRSRGPQKWISESGNGELDPSGFTDIVHPAGTGDSNTRAVINLPAGDHDFLFAWWEGTGGAHVEVTTARGAFTAHNGNFRLLNDTTPRPTVTGIGVLEPGWQVTSLPSNNVDTPITAAAGEFDFFVSGYLDDAATNPDNNSVQTEINFWDPDNGGSANTSRPATPWPLDMPGVDDNDWALRATATLNITEPGEYYLGFQGDDGTFIVIEGAEWLDFESLVGAFIDSSDPVGNPTGMDRLIFDGGSGNNRTVGRLNLAAGTYPLTVEFYEDGGGSYVTVFGAEAAGYEFDAALIPLATDSAGEMFQSPSGLELVGDPLPTGPKFDIVSVDLDQGSGDVTLVFDSEPGANYAVDGSAALASGSWAEVVSPVAGAAGTTTTVVVTRAAIATAIGTSADGQAFLRVRRLP